MPPCDIQESGNSGLKEAICESLHQFLTYLRLKYERAFPTPPVLPPQPEVISDLSEEDNQRLTALLRHEKQAGRLEEYQERREMSLKIQLINGLPLNLREVLVSDDGLLSKPLEQVVKRVASIEAKNRGRVQLTAAMTGVTGTSQVDAVTAENKKWRRAKPKAEDICQKCGGKGLLNPLLSIYRLQMLLQVITCKARLKL